MSSNVRDVAPMTLGNMISDFEPLIDELGPRKAEAFVDALLGTLEDLDSLRDGNGKIRKISESDIIVALKHNFGTEWRDAYERILDKNQGDLTDFINKFNERGDIIENSSHKEFLRINFAKYHDIDLPLLKNVQLSDILCAIRDDAYLNALFAGFIHVKRIKLQTSLDSF